MAKTLTSVNTASDTWQIFINRVNEVIALLGTEAVTANTNANGAATTGNAYLTGIFGANVLVATTGLRGGNVQASDVLSIVSNANFSAVVNVATSILVGNSTVNLIANSSTLKVGANATMGATGLNVGNTTVNAVVNSSSFVTGNSNLNGSGLAVGNTTVNTQINSVSVSTANVFAGANVRVDTTGFYVGNSTVNATQNSIGFVSGLAVSNQLGHYVGANVALDSGSLSVGNSTVNSYANSSQIRTTGSVNVGANLSISTTRVFAGNSTVNASLNSIALILGGNVVANQTHIAIGNTTANLVINSSSIYLNGAAYSSPIGVQQAGSAIGTRSNINFIAGTNVTLNVTDNPGNGRVDVEIIASGGGGSTVAGSNTQVQFNDSGTMNASAAFIFNKSSNTLTVSNTVVANVVSLFGGVRQQAVAISTTGTSAQLVDSFLLTDFRACHYVTSSKDTTANGFQYEELTLLHDDVNTYLDAFALMQSNGNLGAFSANANATAVRVYFTPVPTALDLKIFRISTPI